MYVKDVIDAVATLTLIFWQLLKTRGFWISLLPLYVHPREYLREQLLRHLFPC